MGTLRNSAADLCNVHRHDKRHELLDARVDGTALLDLTRIALPLLHWMRGGPFCQVTAFTMEQKLSSVKTLQVQSRWCEHHVGKPTVPE